MTLDVSRMSTLANGVALEFGRALGATVVATTERGGSRVESLVTMMGCHREPCRLLVNLSRADDETFEREFRAKLKEAIKEHFSSASF